MDAIEQIKSQNLKHFLENQAHKFKKNMTICPFHKDTNPSLTVNTENGVGVWFCHGCNQGGTIIDYMMKKDNLTKAESIQRLKDYYNIEDDKPKLEAEYSYKDKDGKLLYKIKRFKNPKKFRADRKMDGIPRVPYHFQKVIAASEIWLVEGEKDADNASKLGITTTTFPFGLSAWKKDYSKFFKGKTVYICLDRGAEKQAETRAKDIMSVAKEVKIIELPGLENEGEDISDWIELNDSKTYEELKESLELITAETPIYEPIENGIRIINPFLREYIDSVSNVTDAPRLFILFAGLGLLSGLLNRFYFNYPRKTCLNLYILLLAPSTYYRKSVTVDIAADYLSRVNSKLLFPESFTTEALLEILSDQNRGLLRWSELIQVKEFQFGSDYNRGLPSLLTDLFDYKETVKRWTKKGKIEVSGPIISILAAGISNWLVQNLKQIDFQGGIWTRFIFVPAPKEERNFRLPKEFIPDQRIEFALEKLNEIEDSRMDLTRILPLMEKWGRKHMKQTIKLQNDILQANFQRLEIMLLKIACLLQLADNQSTTVEPKTFKDAVRIIEYIKRLLPPFFEEEIKFSEHDKAVTRIQKLIKNEKKIMYRNIQQRTAFTAEVTRKALRELESDGIIKSARKKSTKKGGRPGEVYVYIGD